MFALLWLWRMALCASRRVIAMFALLWLRRMALCAGRRVVAMFALLRLWRVALCARRRVIAMLTFCRRSLVSNRLICPSRHGQGTHSKAERHQQS